MKYIIVVLMILVAAYFILRPRRAQRPKKAKGRLADIDRYLDYLAEANKAEAFLIVTLSGTYDFMQFQCFNSHGYEIDFPLITDRQQSLETQARWAMASVGLEVDETTGSDGSRFLDAHKVGSPEEVSRVVKQLFNRIFGASDTTEVEFQWHGLKPGAR